MRAFVSEDWESGGFGIYVHWPFCLSKCPYCDFNSHVRGSVSQKAWASALVSELESAARATPGRQVDTVFFGGGTPSLMEPETVAAVIQSIQSEWTLSPSAEVNLEANPTSVEAGRFQGFADVGINRISMGVQSLRDDDLKSLGRLHTAQEAREAFDIARNIFQNVNFDLMYARQYQTLENWKLELREAIDMAVDHLSLYQLTIEQGTRFGELNDLGRLRGLPTDELASEMFLATQEICEEAGLPAYEVSNHSKPGAQCRHNLIYWRYGDYVGVGPGAHGRLTIGGKKLATIAPVSPEKWLQMVSQNGQAGRVSEEIPAKAQFVEYLMMSLRLTEGSELSRLAAMVPNGLNYTRLHKLQDDGLLTLTNQRLIATPKGRLLLNWLLGEILAG